MVMDGGGREGGDGLGSGGEGRKMRRRRSLGDGVDVLWGWEMGRRM